MEKKDPIKDGEFESYLRITYRYKLEEELLRTKYGRRIKELEIYKQGKIYLQSLSSMLPPLVLNPKPQENILDMAAAPRRKNNRDGSFVWK